MSRAQQTTAAVSQRRPLAKPQEIADYLGVPLATVYNWKYRGNGPKLIKVGRHLRARWSDIEAYLDQQAG